MRTLTLLACSLAAFAAVATSAGAVGSDAGVLSVERGRGIVALDLRGSVLGRLGNGAIRVTDHTPRDPFTEIVVGRKLVPERVGPRTVVYRGQGLSFRMVGGGYRIGVRGGGISLSAVGRGHVTLDGEPRFAGDDPGVYSIDGTDCGVLPLACIALPLEPERFVLGPRPEDGGGGRNP
jgi:hypothetical protein